MPFCIQDEPGQNSGQKNIRDYLKKVRQTLFQTVIKKPIPYKLAKVYLSEKDWFVHYHYFSKLDGKYHRDKVRLQERGLTLPQKKQKLQELAIVTNQILIKRNKEWLYRDVAAPAQVAQNVTITLFNGVDLASADPRISQEERIHSLPLKNILPVSMSIIHFTRK